MERTLWSSIKGFKFKNNIENTIGEKMISNLEMPDFNKGETLATRKAF